jgi:hypothetical protein
MKTVFVGLFLFLNALNISAQPIRIPVGESRFVLHQPHRDTVKVYCDSPTDQICIFDRVIAFYPTPYCGNKGISDVFSNPQHGCRYYFYYDNTGDNFYFSFDTLSSLSDTLFQYYRQYEVKYDCSAACPYGGQYSLNNSFTFESYYDSTIKINTYGIDTLTFEIDLSKYKSIDHRTLAIFNNRPDTLHCDSATVTIDSLSKVEMTVDKPSTTSFDVLPFNNVVPYIEFQSQASLFPDTTLFHTTLNFFVRNSKGDSIIYVPIVFRFLPEKKSSVHREEETRNNDLQVIYSNSSTNITVKISLDKMAQVLVEVFDILGNKVSTLEDNNLDPGEHKYTLKTASGTYFVRMQTEGEVLTKKVVVIKY